MTDSPQPAIEAPRRFVPLSHERHAHWRWQRFDSYSFAASQWLAPVTAVEIPRATGRLVLGFARDAAGFQPVAVLGLQPGTNLFVTLAGKWIGGYVPASLRSHPFVLARTSDGRRVLCVDEKSEWVGADLATGEPLFDPSGAVAAEVNKVTEFLVKLERQRKVTAAACTALAQHNCLQPMTLRLAGKKEPLRPAGLYQVAGKTLNSLADDAFLDLRRHGALPIAYGQLLSMQHVPLLQQLAKAHEEAAAREAAGSTLLGDGRDLTVFDWGGILSFSGLQ